MAEDKIDWVVIDAAKQVMRCDRCGETEPLSIIMGKRVELATGYMKAFIKVHLDCKVPDAQT